MAWNLLAQGISDTMNLGWNIGQQVIQSKWRKEDIARANDLTQANWAREDNAVQRRALDMKKAGINPLLAAGSAASSSQPLYSSVQRQNSQSPFSNPIEALMARENIATSRAQRQLLLAQAEKTKAEAEQSLGIYEHNMGVVGTNAYGTNPTVMSALLGIIDRFYNGYYEEHGKFPPKATLQDLADDISNITSTPSRYRAYLTEEGIKNLQESSIKKFNEDQARRKKRAADILARRERRSNWREVSDHVRNTPYSY